MRPHGRCYRKHNANVQKKRLPLCVVGTGVLDGPCGKCHRFHIGSRRNRTRFCADRRGRRSLQRKTEFLHFHIGAA